MKIGQQFELGQDWPIVLLVSSINYIGIDIFHIGQSHTETQGL